MRYRCVDAQKAAGFSVVAACTAAGVTRSAYYAWTANVAQGPSDRQREEIRLVGEIRRGKALAQLVEGATVTDASGNVVDLKNLRPDGTIGDPAEAEATAESATDEAATGSDEG